MGEMFSVNVSCRAAHQPRQTECSDDEHHASAVQEADPLGRVPDGIASQSMSPNTVPRQQAARDPADDVLVAADASVE